MEFRRDMTRSDGAESRGLNSALFRPGTTRSHCLPSSKPALANHQHGISNVGIIPSNG